MPDSAWKKMERQVASFFGGHRLLQKGLDVADVAAGRLLIECKYRAKIPRYIRDSYIKLKRRAGTKYIPILCVKEKGMPGFLIIVHSDFFNALIDSERRYG